MAFRDNRMKSEKKKTLNNLVKVSDKERLYHPNPQELWEEYHRVILPPIRGRKNEKNI